MNLKVVWQGDMELTGYSEKGHTLTMDAAEESGGHNKGFLPLELVAVGTAGCASLDIISILKKKKVNFTGFECILNVESYQEGHPHVFTKMHFEYIITGKDIQLKDVERSVQLAEEKYCQAIAMMSKTAKIEHAITIVEK